jgi:RyR domain
MDIDGEERPVSDTERRRLIACAIFVYEAAILQAVSVQAPVIPEHWDERDEAFRTQFVEIIRRQMGPMRSSSPEELHDGWVQAYINMGWTYGPERSVTDKTHPDMVPFDQLEKREQDKDAGFIAL